MIILYGFIAIFIAWIWVDYFRLIDIYDKENLRYFALTFFLGSLSTLLVLLVGEYVLRPTHFGLNGDLLNDALYCFLGIGLVEEVAKLIPFLIVYHFCQRQFNEPIDYIVFISISALGFSAAENVLYFQQYGATVIDGRAILSTVSHMFDTSIIAYGIIKGKFYSNNPNYHGLWKYILIAAFAHGFYDFWLLYEDARPVGWLVTVLYFFMTVSVFATILNNALNYSSFFTYKKTINSDKVVKRLLVYYLMVFLAQFSLLAFKENTLFALRNFQGSLYISGLIILVSVMRLSRFKLIKNHWENIRLELPFNISYGSGSGVSMFGLHLRIKGEAFNETFVNAYYEEFCYLTPLSRSSAYLTKSRLCFIEKKIFLKDSESFYVAKVYHNKENGAFNTILLKPKTDRITMFNEQNPIVAVLRIKNIKDLENTELSAQDFKFREWAVIKPKTIQLDKSVAVSG